MNSYSKIINMLVYNNKIESPEPKRPEEVGRIKDSKYYHYHSIISQPTKDYFILKDKIQTLAKARVLHINEEKK